MFVVEDLKVFEDVSSGFAASGVLLEMDQFHLQSPKKALHGSIVFVFEEHAAIPFAAHALVHSVAFELTPVIFAGALRTSVRMMNEFGSRLPALVGSASAGREDGSQHQGPVETVAHAPADDPACAQIQNTSQIQPALIGRYTVSYTHLTLPTILRV